MKHLHAWLFALLLAVPATGACAAASVAPTAFDSYYMVFLYRGDNPPALDEQASRELQENHLRHLVKMWREGYALVAGPFGGEADDPMRGIVIYRGDLGIERVRELAEADPAVKAGRLRVEVRPWYTEAGVLAFPKRPPPVE